MGDYIRMVGMLWEDAPHEGSNEGRQGDDADNTIDAKHCWKRGRHDLGRVGRGFSEMHPVDFLAKIDPPSRDDMLFAVALCDDASIDRDVTPPGPPPSPGATAAFEEYIDNEFTNLGSVMRKRVTANGDHVTIDIITRNRTDGTLGKFKAIYRVYWQQ